MKNFRIDMYTPIHKSLRKMLFDLSQSAAQCKYDEKEQVAALDMMTKKVLKELKDHSFHENTYLHPIIAPKLSRHTQDLVHEHEVHENDINNLEIILAALTESSEMKKETIGLEFYRSLNRFIAHYLLHLDEEEYMMQNIWELCSPYELFAIMVAFKANEEAHDLPMIMTMVDENLNAGEKEQMFEVIKSRLGEKIYKLISK